ELNGRTEVEVSLLVPKQTPVPGPGAEPASPAAKRDVIELMLVIDVTGSMDDELVYIQKELENVLDRVVKGNPNTQVKLALLFYRDHGDQEVFRYVDFTDVTDQTAFVELKQILLSERADGGGDLPEAVDEALEMAVGKDWSDNTTKLIFHIMDAPAHDEAGARNRFKTAVQTAAKKGIRICPVMASGADRIAEFLCRSEAVMTGGTFVFLTDDSGIGYGHLDPQLPDAVHEHLNHLMVRLILGYHTGTFADPIPWNEEE
ncbi:MAG: VWA domain-containing protein, partial [Lachnospiraceae bacterium]|nr:VWA domain-containing protein [Lachnospiraceae bacterium]